MHSRGFLGYNMASTTIGPGCAINKDSTGLDALGTSKWVESYSLRKPERDVGLCTLTNHLIGDSL